MFLTPWLGECTPLTASSVMLASKVKPGTIWLLFASMIASLTPLAVGTPSDASPPDNGRSTPILITVPPEEPLVFWAFWVFEPPEHDARSAPLKPAAAAAKSQRVTMVDPMVAIISVQGNARAKKAS